MPMAWPLAHVYGEPSNAIAFSDQRLTDDEAEKIARLIVRLSELVELERERNNAKSRRRSPPLQRPVTLGDLARDGKLLEVECSACRPSRHFYIEPLSLRLPKRLAGAGHGKLPSSAASVVPGMTSLKGRYTRGRMRGC